MNCHEFLCSFSHVSTSLCTAANCSLCLVSRSAHHIKQTPRAISSAPIKQLRFEHAESFECLDESGFPKPTLSAQGLQVARSHIISSSRNDVYLSFQCYGRILHVPGVVTFAAASLVNRALPYKPGIHQQRQGVQYVLNNTYGNANDFFCV